MKSPPKDPSDENASPGLVSLESAIFKDVKVVLEASLGRAEMSVADLMALKAGSVVALEARLNEPVEIRLNEATVARGEIVAVGDNFGVRIIEVAKG